MKPKLNLVGTALCGVLAAMLITATLAYGQVETIDATSRGTSTQMGKTFNIKLIITRYSTPEEQKALITAFQQGQSKGLTEALSKMKSAGQIQVPGTVGYALAYVASVATPTGRKVSFVTNRKISFREAYRNTRSQAFDLTAGEIDIDNQDSKTSAGVLFPATQLVINKDGELQWELNRNPWQLTNIIDWTPKGKE